MNKSYVSALLFLMFVLTEGSPNYRHPDLCFAQAGDPSAHNLGCLAVSGTWTINLTFICGKAIHTAVIAQKDSTLTGTYKGEVKEGRLFGRVKGNAIEFTGSLRVEAQGISFRYTGTIEGDTMKGTVDMGEYWTGTWTAKRKQ